jgi:alpha-galactosidase
MREKKQVVEKRNYPILWDQIGIQPSIQLKYGIRRKLFPLYKILTEKRGELAFGNDFVKLTGKWDNSPEFASLLSLKLTNISKKSIRLTRLVFPTENGLDAFLNGFNPGDISFLRNGYQSWSTSRSYKITDKPLRPWLQIVSLTSSNLANLPSNTPGNLSSEMYSVITDLKKQESFLVGQAAPFNQFFYIRLVLFKKESRESYFELVFDFGRKMIMPGETVNLDGILMAKGEPFLQEKYFNYIKKQMKIKIPDENVRGWSTWYYYYNKITPEIIYKNIDVIKSKKIDLDFIQVDDGYQKFVGDWLDLNPPFIDKMKEISDKIKEAGYKPGIWIAPFIADKKSDLVQTYPDYLLRTEYGRAIIGGYNPVWPGRYYYGLDITNPRFEEHIRNVIRTIAKEWGFEYFKLDFMFGGCLRGGNHINFKLTRAEVLKYGLKIIREEAGNSAVLVGCGMPLSPGIGTVNSMRVGPDTAPQWIKRMGNFLRTGAMIGTRNSTRNFMVRSFMHKRLWLNDPDCLMLRSTKTSLSKYERMSHINSVILSGGLLLFSDNFEELTDDNFDEMEIINAVSRECFKGNAIPVDIMEKEIPEIFYNTSGYIGFFNFKNYSATKEFDLSEMPWIEQKSCQLQDIWTNEIIDIPLNRVIYLKNMPKHSSRLFKLLEMPAKHLLH